MVRFIQVPVLVTLILGGCRPQDSRPDHSVEDLSLVKAYPVESGQPVEPSGLIAHEGTFYTIADKVDDTIFRLEFSSETVQMVPHVTFAPPPGLVMDWEGLACDQSGNFHLVSERQGRVLAVAPDLRASWITPDLREDGRPDGLFAKRNAGFEGITMLGKDHWLAAVEREPRGLVEWSMAGGKLEIDSFVYTGSPYKAALPLLRFPDYAGLDVDNGKVYALFRNAHLVVRLEREPDGWREVEAWSFRHIETDPRWAYVSQTYGQAEGLVVEGRDVYLIFDNNRGSRKNDPRDRRPLLVHASFPEGN